VDAHPGRRHKLKAMEEREPDNMTQAEVAALLQVSPQRVGQIERRALAKIRKAIESGEYPALAEHMGGDFRRLLERDRDERRKLLERQRKVNQRWRTRR